MKTLLFLSAVLLPTSVFAAPAVSKEAAAKTALAAVPAGTVKSSELETERGRQFYSFDIVVPGKTGVEEVHVSAATGRVL